MSDHRSPTTPDDELLEALAAEDDTETGCTGCGCLGPTFAVVLTALTGLLLYALMKRIR